MSRIDRITLYPIKSLDGADVSRAELLPSGALRHDRRYAFVDPDNKFVNGKRNRRIHEIRCEFSSDLELCTLRSSALCSGPHRLGGGARELAQWVGELLALECRLVEDRETGLPDDTDSPGPTLISTQSLEAIAGWYGMPVGECRRRFRANLEIDAPHAFWEDSLVGRDFRVGRAVLHGAGVCQRCVVPSRDPHTGAALAGFQKRFVERRQATLPGDSPRAAFDHFYRVAINTRLAGPPALVSLGDQVEVLPLGPAPGC